MSLPFFTVGHSARTIGEFIELPLNFFPPMSFLNADRDRDGKNRAMTNTVKREKVKPTAQPLTVSGSDGLRAKPLVIKHSILKRSIQRDGHKSSVSLEDQFWDALCKIADRKNMSVSTLVATIDHGTNRNNLSSAIRVFVLDYFKRNSEHKPPVDQSNRGTPAASAIH
jgi:predicted DNA-binding ribbon-helix-helix protein